MISNLYEIKNLWLSFPDFNRKPLIGPTPKIEILKGLTFNIPKGQITGIVGGSGSGKSTLGRCLIRLLEPDAGKLVFNEIDIAHWNEGQIRPMRNKLQMIFQDPMSALNPRKRIKGIISGPMHVHRVTGIKQKVSLALEMVGLSQSLAERFPHELSGGQRQRVGIARAIALQPEFIVADEIVSGLDVSSQAQVVNLLERLVKDLGLTLLFISHDLSVIRKLCSNVVVMKSGKIVEKASVENLFCKPKSAYTKELLNAVPLPDMSQKWF